MDRWATFDCYGTLVDWNAGIARELGRLFGAERRATLLARYHVSEPRIQSERPTSSYRDVLAAVLAELPSGKPTWKPPTPASSERFHYARRNWSRAATILSRRAKRRSPRRRPTRP